MNNDDLATKALIARVQQKFDQLAQFEQEGATLYSQVPHFAARFVAPLPKSLTTMPAVKRTPTVLDEKLDWGYTTPIGKWVDILEKKASPQAVQAPVASKGNILEGYAAVWYDADGLPYVDNYLDWVSPGSWKDTIENAYRKRKRTGHEHLLPHLFQHKVDEIIGGVLHLGEDSKGVIYESKLAMGVQRARDTYELAKNGLLGTSYGYDPISRIPMQDHYTGKPYYKLAKIEAHELSAVVMPANPYSTAHAKTRSDGYYELMAHAHEVRELNRLPTTPQNRAMLTKAVDALDSMVEQVQQQQSRGRYSYGKPTRQDARLQDAIARVDDIFNDAQLCYELER